MKLWFKNNDIQIISVLYVYSYDLSCLVASLTIMSAAKSMSSCEVFGPTLRRRVPTAKSGGTFIAFRMAEYDIVGPDDE